jgi:hypothetical protein
MGDVNIALGGLVSRHWAPESLTPLYGTSLDSWTVFLRARLAP